MVLKTLLATRTKDASKVIENEDIAMTARGVVPPEDVRHAKGVFIPPVHKNTLLSLNSSRAESLSGLTERLEKRCPHKRMCACARACVRVLRHARVFKCVYPLNISIIRSLPSDDLKKNCSGS